MNSLELEKVVPFDQYSRQFQVSIILKILKKNKKPLAILDVGGYKGRSKDFLPSDDVTVVDLYDIKEEGYVRGSGFDLPFPFRSFDFVVSFDTLEHIPVNKRDNFIEECERVAKRGIIICAPNKTPENELIEEKLNDLYKKLHHKSHRWLEEHMEYKIPDFDLLEKKVQEHGIFTNRFYSNKSQLWFLMQQAIFMNSKFTFGAEKLIELNEFYNKNFKYDGGGSDITSYRQILCGLENEDESTNLNKAMSKFNNPIEPLIELELIEKINDYFTTLIIKTAQQSKNYEDLYMFNMNLAEEREKINKNLQTRINQYEKLLPAKIIIKTKQMLRKVKK
ncbi:MAG: class I SAM-dependent methyltransferase [Candidatus Saccharimonadales bacterium]